MLIKISMNTGSEKTKKLKIAVILLPLPFESPGVSPVDSLVCILSDFFNAYTNVTQIYLRSL